ncbi:hypothetical protein [Rhodovulum adriaticum]|uniref:Uncharacterized protein n=1 Tax=Rhodovulum adriaticum TaxID=35804 RepID=A0A4R2NY43_RHOAD|nr:hypothetical protein [Rhodovulum adriaticum]MBK1636212.1 hypothetical protein [Rhodovulum adriaticum]TCP26534.1 hypothetical protein EV656_102503 [Rhodovulum adriaticum]
MRAAARAILSLLLVLSLVLTGWSGWQLLSNWPAAALTEKAADRIAADLSVALARAGQAGDLDARLAALLDETPRNWTAISAIEGEMTRQGHPPPSDLAARRDQLYAADHGAAARVRACAACAFDLRRCTLENAALCGLPALMTPLPDIAGLGRAGHAFATGGEIDEVDLVLSAVGLGAAALVVPSGGSSAAVKAGAASLRLARAMGRLPAGLTRVLSRAAREGFDWGGIAGARSAQDIAALARPAELRPALNLLEDGGRLRRALGPAAALHVLSHAEDATELKRLAMIADAAPARTVAGLETLGKSRFLRLATRLSNRALHLAAGLAGLAAALAGLFANAITTGLLRGLRRVARG